MDFRVWKEITLNSSADQSQYRVWDYPIKEQYAHILIAMEKTGTLESAEEGFRKVLLLFIYFFRSLFYARKN